VKKKSKARIGYSLVIVILILWILKRLMFGRSGGTEGPNAQIQKQAIPEPLPSMGSGNSEPQNGIEAIGETIAKYPEISLEWLKLIDQDALMIMRDENRIAYIQEGKVSEVDVEDKHLRITVREIVERYQGDRGITVFYLVRKYAENPFDHHLGNLFLDIMEPYEERGSKRVSFESNIVQMGDLSLEPEEYGESESERN
jgi:hypothetical protein